MNVLVLAPTRKEGCGIAEYTRQVFLRKHDQHIDDMTLFNFLTAPIWNMDIIHVQFEFFLFDRFVGVTAFFWFAYWKLFAWLWGYRLVTTVHSTYDTDNLWNEFPQYRQYWFLYGPGRLYLSALYWWVCACSDEVVALCEPGRTQLQKHTRKAIRVEPLPAYKPSTVPRDHGLINAPFFACFGFMFPNKGFDIAIEATKLLVDKWTDLRLYIVGGAPANPGCPIGNAHTHNEELRRLVNKLYCIRFTGYLNNDDPLLEEICLKVKAWIFPYRERNCPSGAFQTALATGRPIIVSTAKCFDGHPELPRFPIDDSGALAEQMDKIMKS